MARARGSPADPRALFRFRHAEHAMNRLEDVDVSGVHLVGSPANHRPFALFKSKAAPTREEPETMKLTTAEFKKRIATQVEGDISDEKLASLAKAIGIELAAEKPA